MIMIPVAEFILREHCYKPIGGDVLFIGRQTVPFSAEAHEELLRRHGLVNHARGPIEYDTETRAAQGRNYITDRYFMRSLSPEVRFRSLDVTNYENADIVHNLGYPVDQKYHGQFDFIYNGSCFDNMFNAGEALINLSRMLKPSGRLICVESASSFGGAYVMFSPGWFHDFFVCNRYADCKIYLARYRGIRQLILGPNSIYFVNFPAEPQGHTPQPKTRVNWMAFVLAEKDRNSTDNVQPIQLQYRMGDAINEQYRESNALICQHTRPLLFGATLNPGASPYLNYLGKLGEDHRPIGRRSVELLNRAGWALARRLYWGAQWGLSRIGRHKGDLSR